jgi:hypothetical protein
MGKCGRQYGYSPQAHTGGWGGTWAHRNGKVGTAPWAHVAGGLAQLRSLHGAPAGIIAP